MGELLGLGEWFADFARFGVRFWDCVFPEVGKFSTRGWIDLNRGADFSLRGSRIRRGRRLKSAPLFSGSYKSWNSLWLLVETAFSPN